MCQGGVGELKFAVLILAYDGSNRNQGFPFEGEKLEHAGGSSFGQEVEGPIQLAQQKGSLGQGRSASDERRADRGQNLDTRAVAAIRLGKKRDQRPRVEENTLPIHSPKPSM